MHVLVSLLMLTDMLKDIFTLKKILMDFHVQSFFVLV